MTEKKEFRIRLIFFIFGFLSHAVILWLATELFQGKHVFVEHFLELPCLLILSALATAWLMPELIPKDGRSNVAGFVRSILRGSLLGLLTTGCALSVFLVIASIVLGIRSSESILQFPLTTFFVLLGLATYGLGGIIGILPYAAVNGLFAAVAIRFLAKPAPIHEDCGAELTDLSRESVAASIMSLVLFWKPLLGVGFGVAAVIGGLYSITKMSKATVPQRRRAIFGISVGVVVLAFILALSWGSWMRSN